MSDRLQDVASGRARANRKGVSGWLAGRGDRREYWLFTVPVMVVATLATMAELTPLAYLMSFGLMFVWVRRFHDLGFSGWLGPAINVGLSVLGFVVQSLLNSTAGSSLSGLVSLAVIIVLGCLPGEARINEYGPPSGKAADLDQTFS